MSMHSFQNMCVRCQINTKGFFTEQMFSRFDAINIDALMQIVWHSAVDSINIGPVQQIMIVLGDKLDGIERVLEPAHHSRIGIADTDNTRHDILIKQMTPTCDCTTELTSH